MAKKRKNRGTIVPVLNLILNFCRLLVAVAALQLLGPENASYASDLIAGYM